MDMGTIIVYLFFGILGGLLIYGIGINSYNSIKIYSAINKNNNDFKYNSLTRIIKKNIGDGNYYYPQFHDGKDWVDFLNTDCYSYEKSEYYPNISRCENFIINKKASKKPDIEVIKTSEELEELYNLRDYEK